MNKETTTPEKSNNGENAPPTKREPGMLGSALTAPTWWRLAVGVAAAAGGGLLAAAVVGVGPAAIAGAAGYLAYRGLKKTDQPVSH